MCRWRRRDGGLEDEPGRSLISSRRVRHMYILYIQVIHTSCRYLSIVYSMSVLVHAGSSII